MSFTTCIDTVTLATALDDPACAIVDCRFALNDLAWGEEAYEKSHVPGAVYAHLERDLSGAPSGSNGRHPLPDPWRLAVSLGQLGIAAGVQVVAYDQDAGSYASRLWWLLRWLGHDAVAVLDGGFAAWESAGRPTRAGRESRPPRRFDAHVRHQMVADTAMVETMRVRHDWRLVDARAPERFRGDVEPIDRVPGHIPGAVNHFFKNNLNDQGVFRSGGALRRAWVETLGGVDAAHTICYCGSGVTACQNLLAMERAGLSGARLYVGSWSEWASDPGRMVGRGNEGKVEKS